MSLKIAPAPVRKTLQVKASQARAFEVFTAGFARWWPATHSIGKSALKDAIMEPQVGGRWYERGEDGSECDWGRVLAWEPPARLVLSWQLSAQWKFDPDLLTEVEVRFIDEAGERTRVELEHRNLDRHGDGWEATRDAIGGDDGWPLYLQRFADVIAEQG